MKKLLTTLLLSIIFLTTGKAQNLIGSSLRDAHKILDEKGYIIQKGYTDDNVYYITAADNESVRIYYFSSNNICVMFAISYKGFTYTEIKQILNKAGYWQVNDQFYTNDYKATIIYMNEYECYFVVVIPRL